MSAPAPPSATAVEAQPDDGVAAEVVVAKIAQSGDLGRTMVERAYYAALSEKLAAQLAELRQQGSTDKADTVET